MGCGVADAVGAGDGGEEEEEEEASGFAADGEAAVAFGAGGASRGISRLSGADSIICGVELKYRARLGRRNVGGNADAGILMSRTDFRSDLLNIFRNMRSSPLIDCGTLFEAFRD